LEERPIYRAGGEYGLRVTGSEDLVVQVIGPFEVGEIEEVEAGEYSTTLGFYQAGMADVLVVATDGCRMEMDHLRVEVAPPRVVKLAAGVAHTCALRVDGQVACWGSDELIRMILEDSFGEEPDPGWEAQGDPLAVPDGELFVDLFAGAVSNCGVRADGTLRCWGATLNNEPFPAPRAHLTTMSLGFGGSCGVTVDGQGYCWDVEGEIFFTPEDVVGAPTDREFRQIWDTTFWGRRMVVHFDDDEAFRVPWPDSTSNMVPILEGANFASAAATIFSFCGISSDGHMLCEFASIEGSDEVLLDFHDPTPGAVDIAAGMALGCALYDTGQIRCVGDLMLFQDGFSEELGVDTENLEFSLDVPPGSYVNVTVGYLHSCAVTTEEVVKCWGIFPFEGSMLEPITAPIQ
jgi:hypothetical protein